MPPSISICIPSYNSERYVRTTIESALAQEQPAAEVIISDDRSPDRSYEICREYEHLPNVTVTRPPERTTLGGHYRYLLSLAKSDYVCFLSSDDALMPDFTTRMQRVLAEHQDLSIIAGACIETDSHLVPERIRGSGQPKTTLPFPESFRYFATGCVYTISFSLLSRRILSAAPALPKSGDLATDWYWSMILGAGGRAAFIREPLGYYRIHHSNAGHNNGAAWERACAEMLPFLKSNLPSELGNELDGWIETLRVQNEETTARELAGTTKEPEVKSSKDKARDLLKRALAARHRKLPLVITQAERGVSTALSL